MCQICLSSILCNRCKTCNSYLSKGIRGFTDYSLPPIFGMLNRNDSLAAEDDQHEEALLNGTEEQPLLGEDHGTRSKSIVPSNRFLLWLAPFLKKYWQLSRDYVRKNKYCSVPIGLVSFLLVYTLIALVFKTEKVYQSAITLDISKLSVDGVYDEGIDFTVKGTVAFDYGDVTWWLKAVFIPLSYMVGQLNLATTKPIGIFINLPDGLEPKTFYNPIEIEIPEVWFDLMPGSVNSFELPVKATVDSFDLVRLFGHYTYIVDGKGLDAFDVYVVLKTGVKAHKWSFPLGDYNTDIRRKINVESNNALLPEYEVKINDVTPTSKCIVGDAGIRVRGIGIPISMKLPTIDWDVFIPGCTSSIVILNSFQTDPIIFDRIEDVDIHVTAVVEELSPKLTKICSDGISPINRFFNKAITDGTARVFVKARSLSDNNKKLPKWIHLFLSNNFQPFVVDTSGSSSDFGTLDISTSDIKLVLPNDQHQLPTIDTQALVKLNSLPKGYNSENEFVEVKEVTGSVELSNDGETALRIYLHQWQKVKTNDTDLILSVAGAKADIVDDKLTASFFQSYLAGERFNITVEVLLDFVVATPVLNTALQGIDKSFTLAVIPQDGLLESFNLNLTELLYKASSSQLELETIATIDIENPRSIGTDLQYLSLNISYNDTNIGTLELANTSIEGNFTSTITPVLRLIKGDNPSVLQDFVSRYLSSKDPQIFVKGHENSTQSLAVAKTLSHLSIPFKIPTFQGTDSDREGFILDCTFHVLKSYAQVTVYNPFKNQPVQVTIKEAIVTHNDVEIAYIDNPPILILAPGISRTPPIPITYPQGLPKDLLKNAINGNLDVTTVAQFNFIIDTFSLDLVYEGEGLSAKIRW